MGLRYKSFCTYICYKWRGGLCLPAIRAKAMRQQLGRELPKSLIGAERESGPFVFSSYIFEAVLSPRPSLSPTVGIGDPSKCKPLIQELPSLSLSLSHFAAEERDRARSRAGVNSKRP